MTLVRKEFVGVLKNTISGDGVSPEVGMVAFPIDLFHAGSDLAPIRERRREFYEGLTREVPKLAKAAARSMLSVEGASYEEALRRANALFLKENWGDGLPLWPATKERVDWILRGAALPRGHVLGKLPPRKATVTVESCAIALAMAGGRPEYLPVLVAAVDAILDPAADTSNLQSTSASVFPVVIVNGPIAGQIRLNAGFGCMGPDPRHPAGASIGRALRQLQQNLGGAVPGVGSMAVWGAMRYTNVVFAEDEAGLPEGWASHAAERHGYAPGTNSISLVFATGMSNIQRRGTGKDTPEEEALRSLHRTAGFLAVPYLHYARGYEDGGPGMLVVPGAVAKSLAEAGWSKQKIREFLWEHSKVPRQKMAESGCDAWLSIDESQVVRDSVKLEHWPITARPENIAILVTGGGHATNAYWMFSSSWRFIGREIAVPEGLQRLLDEAAAEQA